MDAPTLRATACECGDPVPLHRPTGCPYCACRHDVIAALLTSGALDGAA